MSSEKFPLELTSLMNTVTALAQKQLATETDTAAENMLVVPDEKCPAFIKHNLANAQNELEQIYYSYEGRMIFKWHHYLAIYDRYMQIYKRLALANKNNPKAEIAPNGKLRILEIGVQNGGSLQLWRRYFGDDAIIFGIDIMPECKKFEENGVNIRIGSQADPAFLNSVIEEMGGLDIVIDDGSHIANHQLASFRALFPHLSNGGIYICEDVHTAYWNDWEGGLKREGTFIEVAKTMVDHMHEWYVYAPSNLSDMKLRDSVLAIAFYDSVVAIEKGIKVRPYAASVGTRSF